MKDFNRLINIALYLSILTIVYNVIEGIISLYFGYQDETLALFGFGVDSFVEVFSGFGILNMILLTKKNGNKNHFEKNALRITAVSFYVLSFGLIITSIINMYNYHSPVTTQWGIVISIISLAIMWLLIYKKKQVGYELKSDAIIADANCNKVCMQLSLVLLLSSLSYSIFNIGYFDSLGAMLIAYLSFKEGREAYLKSKNQKACC